MESDRDGDDKNEENALRSDFVEVLKDPRLEFEKSIAMSKLFAMKSSNSAPWKTKGTLGSKLTGGSGAIS